MGFRIEQSLCFKLPVNFNQHVTKLPQQAGTNSLIIDQHFRQRDRLGRLLTAVFYSPSQTGIGIDENTAAFINPEGEFEVVGSGAVTVVDPSNLQYSSTDSVRPGKPLSLIGLTVHILTSGARYDVNTRLATPAPEPQMC